MLSAISEEADALTEEYSNKVKSLKDKLADIAKNKAEDRKRSSRLKCIPMHP